MPRPSPIVAVALVALVASLGLAACGGDGEPAPTSEPVAAATPAADPQRYCALGRELDAAGSRVFARLERENASPAEFEAAERRFIEQSSGQLDELERVAPSEIAADVRTLLAGQRERAGLKTAVEVSESAATAAEKRVQAFEQRHCGE